MNNITVTPKSQDAGFDHYRGLTYSQRKHVQKYDKFEYHKLLNLPLVSTSISPREIKQGIEEVHFYRNSLKIKHPKMLSQAKQKTVPNRSDTTITGFSFGSRNRLRHIAANSSDSLISQYCLTYHNDFPTDGKECKRHLRAFLQFLRRNFPEMYYLWIMEFQKRGAPHFHLFFNVKPDKHIWDKITSAWIRISGGSKDAEWWHGSERGENWLDWDMGTASYLTKYLDKAAQKVVPAGYHNFGRFWGHSREIVPVPLVMPAADLENISTVNKETGEIYGGKRTVLRWLGKYAEKSTNGYSRFRSRVAKYSYTVWGGTNIYTKIEDYFYKLEFQRKTNGFLTFCEETR